MSPSLMTTKALAGHSVGYCAQRVFRRSPIPQRKRFSPTRSVLSSAALFSTSSSVAYLVSHSLSGSRLVGNNTPVIFITAYEDPKTRAAAEAVGCAAYFRKTDSGAEVLEVIQRALTHK